MTEPTIQLILNFVAVVLIPWVAWLFRKITSLEKNVALLDKIVEEREKARQAAERIRDERMKELLERVRHLDDNVMSLVRK